VEPRPEALAAVELQTAVLVRHFEMVYRRTGIHDDLDRAEYLLLRTLDESGPQDINTLAASLGLDPSTAGRQVSALQAAGLAVRSPAPADRRRSIVTPTPEGLRQMKHVQQLRAECVADLLTDWSDEDVHALGAMFDKYNKSVATRYFTSAPPLAGSARPTAST